MNFRSLFDSLVHNWRSCEQFVVILIGFWCMGAGCGFERSLLPRMAVQIFEETKASTRLHFVATFGLSKAIANAISGPLADKFGRKPTLVLGCLVGLPVMPYVIVAKSWSGITLMNGAFGLSQGLLGSALFFLLIDVMGPQKRGVAVGIGECSIYVSTALVNILAGQLATKYGYRPVPFYVATGFSVVGLLSTIPLKDTLDQVRAEQTASERSLRKKYARMMSTQPSKADEELYLKNLPQENLEGYVSPWKHSSRSLALEDEDEEDEEKPLMADNTGDSYKALSVGAASSSHHAPSSDAGLTSNGSATTSERDTPVETISKLLLHNPSYVTLCLGGMVLNFKDGFAWGSFPVFFKHQHQLSDANTDLLVALYPLCWGFAQAFTGALSDKFGRKVFLVSGTALCSLSMMLFALPQVAWGEVGDQRHVGTWIVADVMLGLGTAMAYPSLQAGAADEVEPMNRGLALGFYRFVRDMGYVVGAIVCGHLTDSIGYESTFLVNAAVLGVSLLSMIFVYQAPPENDYSIIVTNDETNANTNGPASKEEANGETPKMKHREPSPKKVRLVLKARCSDSW